MHFSTSSALLHDRSLVPCHPSHETLIPCREMSLHPLGMMLTR